MRILESIYRRLESYLYDESYEELENKYWKERIKAEELEEENELLKERLGRGIYR